MPRPPSQVLQHRRVAEATVAWFSCDSLMDEWLIDQVGRELTELLRQAKPPRLIVNFRGVGAISSGMVGKLFAAYRQAQAAGGGIAVCDVDATLTEVLEVARFHRLVPVYADEQEALAALARGGG